MAIGLAKKDATVIIICRSTEKAQEAAELIRQITGSKKIFCYNADLSVQNDIKLVAQEIAGGFDRIDVLINNAACVTSTLEFTADGVEKQLAVNHVAPFLLTHYLLPLITKSADGRIINVNSRAHGRGTMHFDDLFLQKGYNISVAYNQSKLANMLFTYALANKLASTGISVNAFHPGLVNTEFGVKGVSALHKFAWVIISKLGRSAKVAAEDGIYLALDEKLKNITGKYFHNKQPISSSALSYNSVWAEKLWAVTLQWTKLKADGYGKVS